MSSWTQFPWELMEKFMGTFCQVLESENDKIKEDNSIIPLGKDHNRCEDKVFIFTSICFVKCTEYVSFLVSFATVKYKPVIGLLGRAGAARSRRDRSENPCVFYFKKKESQIIFPPSLQIS